jgi:nitrogen fixation protein FixH
VTAPGLVVAGHYDRGENYGATLAARARAGELGWRATPDFGALRAGTPGEALLTLHDGAGNELVAERVTLHAYRPADARADFHTDLTPRAVGRYGAALTFPAPGAWDLVIEVQRGGERAEFAQRVHLR